jgi:hypothetical protein
VAYGILLTPSTSKDEGTMFLQSSGKHTRQPSITSQKISDLSETDVETTHLKTYGLFRHTVEFKRWEIKAL